MVGIILGNGGGSGADVSNVDATAGDVLAPKIFVDSNGDEITGTIPTYSGTANLVPDGSDHPFSNIYIPANGLTVKAISLQEKTVYPSGSSQNVVPDADKYLSKVTVKQLKNKGNGLLAPDNTTTLTIPANTTINKLFGIYVHYDDSTYTSKSYSRVIASFLFKKAGIEADDVMTSVYVKASSDGSWNCSMAGLAKYVYIYSLDKSTGTIVLKGETTYHRFYDYYDWKILYC